MNLGQVYTKSSVADFMVSLFDLPENSRVLDPCFGRGAFVHALLAKTKCHIDAIEIDKKSFSSCKEVNSSRLNLFCRSFFDHTRTGYDGIIMNPPYVRQEEIDQLSSVGVTKELLKKSCNRFDIPSKANLYVYFIIHAIDLLRTGGQLIIIFPNSWKKNTFASFIDQVFTASGYVSKLFDVRGNPFEGSPLVDVCIVKFIKGENGNSIRHALIVSEDSIAIGELASTEYSYASESTVPLGTICSLKRGLTTFFNRMFINPRIDDNTFLTPILSTPKSLNGWTTEGAVLDKLLLVPDSVVVSAEISDYLEFFKKKIIRETKPITLYKRILAYSDWYSLPTHRPGKIVFSYIIRNRPVFVLNTASVIVRDNFYVLSHVYDDYLMFALLNNYYVYSQLEEKGKNYGNGILKIQKYDVDSLFVVNPDLIAPSVKNKLIILAKQLISSRDVKIISDITGELSGFYPVANVEEIYKRQKANRLKHE